MDIVCHFPCGTGRTSIKWEPSVGVSRYDIAVRSLSGRTVPVGAVVELPCGWDRVQSTVNVDSYKSLFQKYLKELSKMFNYFIGGKRTRYVDHTLIGRATKFQVHGSLAFEIRAVYKKIRFFQKR